MVWDDAFRRKLEEAFVLLEEAQVAEKERVIEIVGPDNIAFSTRFKRKLNRIYRERLGVKDADIPHPEVDTPYERVRGRMVRFFTRLTGRR